MNRSAASHRAFRRLEAWLRDRAVGIFIVLALAFGGLFVWVTPPLMGGDEAAHLGRVWQLGDGHITSDRLSSGEYGGTVPMNLDVAAQQVSAQLAHESTTEHSFRPADGFSELIKQPLSLEETVVGFTGAATYSPLAYGPMVPAAMVARLASVSVERLIYVVRLTNLVTFVALGIWALWLLRGRKTQWLVLAVLLLPMSLYEAATINGDAILIGLSLVLVAGLLRYWHDAKPSRTILIMLCVVAALLPLTKNIGLFLALLVPLAFVLRQQWGRRSYVYALGLAAVFCLPGLLWGLASSQAAQSIGLIVGDPLAPFHTAGMAQRVGAWLGSTPHGIDPAEQIAFMLSHPLQAVGILVVTPLWYAPHFLTGIVGMLGTSWVWAPVPVTLLGLFGLLVAWGQADELRGSPRLWRLGLLAVCGLGIVAMMAGLYITFTPVTWWVVRGMQGRYFLPFLPFIFWGLARRRKRAWLRQKTRNSYATLLTAISLINALVMVLLYARAMRG